MKRQLVIFSSSQFGYLTDTYKYCQYAREHFDITFLCWDYNNPKQMIQDINVKYVSRKGNLVERNLRLLYALYKQICNDKFLVFANYTPGISIIKLFCIKQRVLVDVRTLSVNPTKLIRMFSDIILRCELFFFRDISVVSHAVARKLGLKKYTVIPLGGESFCAGLKLFDSLHLIYVGTLQGRRILDCVKGFHNYLIRSAPQSNADMFFTIIGDSPGAERDEIQRYVDANDLGMNVRIRGYIPNENLGPFFEEANVGVSYIPLTTYFDGQPPTKTFEYVLSGMPVIATRTMANQGIIDANSGVLIEDNVDSFERGIERIARNSSRFNSEYIRNHYSNYQWRNIVHRIFIPKVSSSGMEICSDALITSEP